MTLESNPAPGDLLLTRIFDAPRPLVFKAWTDPAQLAQWWGPDGFTNPRCELDPRPGGLIRVDMRAADGAIYPMPGAYREIVEPERIVFTTGALGPDGLLLFEILNTATFAEADGKTILTLHTQILRTTPAAAQYLDGQSMGWSQSLERFAAFIQPPRPPEPGALQAAAAASGPRLVISRLLTAPRDLVWDAMTDPRHVVQWWGPHGFTTTVQEMDLRPGGTWQYTMHGPDGAEYPNKSTFTEVAKPARLAFSHGGARKGGPAVSFQSTWTFDALDDNRTRVTIHMVFPTTEARENVVRDFGALEGGRQTLERLAGQLAKAPFTIDRTFDATVQMVWKAITDREQMKEWYFDIPNFSPEPGHQFDFSVEHQGMTYKHLCKVTEVIPGKKIAYTWRYKDEPGDSLVTFELFPEGSKTRLKLTHAGLDTFPHFPTYARSNFVAGWTTLIGASLMTFLENAQTNAPKE